MKTSSSKKLISGLLHSKLVLYAVSIFTLVNIFGYMMTGCTYTVAFFVLTAFVTSKFTKNMIIVLGASLALTNAFMVCYVVKENFAPIEGFEGKGKKESMKTEKDKDTESMKSKGEKCDEGMSWDEKSEKCVKKEEMTVGYKKNNRLDYAATVEEAYDDLDKILGADGIKNLTNDTEKLVKQQQQLAGLMKNMGPMVGQVKEMMSSMGGSEGMQKMMGQLSSKIGGK
jgi:hypothetical protein